MSTLIAHNEPLKFSINTGSISHDDKTSTENHRRWSCSPSRPWGDTLLHRGTKLHFHISNFSQVSAPFSGVNTEQYQSNIYSVAWDSNFFSICNHFTLFPTPNHYVLAWTSLKKEDGVARLSLAYHITRLLSGSKIILIIQLIITQNNGLEDGTPRYDCGRLQCYAECTYENVIMRSRFPSIWQFRRYGFRDEWL
jgi:hypothetical protein